MHPESSPAATQPDANVDFLHVPVVSGDLHQAGRFGGLQFAQICVECVMAVGVFFFSSEGLVCQGFFQH
ncbi:hypothetical protein A2U01_0049139, partial [Trifolium medium]|nr:hypothetical protein [Trifolium medium]